MARQRILGGYVARRKKEMTLTHGARVMSGKGEEGGVRADWAAGLAGCAEMEGAGPGRAEERTGLRLRENRPADKLGCSPRERSKIPFPFSFLFCFQSQFKYDQSQIQMGFQIYFFSSSKNEEF